MRKRKERFKRKRWYAIEKLESRNLLAAHLVVSLDQTSILESAGVAAVSVTLARVESPDLAVALTVALSVDDPDEIAIPETITIPANQSEVTFSIDTINDGQVDGTTSVTLQASAVGNDSGSAQLDVLDDDTSSAIVVGGELSGTLPNGTLTLSHSIVVPAGSTLTIPSATEVLFADDQALEVSGTLLAEGTSTEPIRFGSSATSTAPGDWSGIDFRSAFDQQRSILDTVIVENATTGIRVLGQNSPVTIENSEIRRNEENGILVIDDNTTGAVIRSNWIHDNGMNGIRLSSTGSGCDNSAVLSIDVIGNQIDHNGASGIRMYGSGSNSCAIAIFVSAGANLSPTISGNRIHNNFDGINLFLADSSKFNSQYEGEITNNFIYDQVNDGIVIDTNTTDSRVEPKIVNNTVVRNGGNGIFHHDAIDPQIRIFNNLVSGNLRGIATNVGYTHENGTIGFNNVTNNLSSNWHNYPANLEFGLPTSVNANNLPSDAFNNLSSPPDFTNDQLHISLTSPNVGSGAEASASLPVPEFDFDGDVRTELPDIGADEVHKTFITLEPEGPQDNTTTVLPGIYQILEGTPANSITGTIHRTAADRSVSALVQLINPNESVFSMPSEVLIPADATSAQFAISTVDDGDIEDPMDLTVRGHLEESFGVGKQIRVIDDDLATATPTLDGPQKVDHVDSGNADQAPDITWLDDNTYVVVWYSHSFQSPSIEARFYNGDDSPRGDQLTIGTFADGQVGGDVRIASNGNGTFVAAYETFENIAPPGAARIDSTQFVMRRFDNTGAPLTPPVTTPATRRQAIISLVMDSSNGWTAVHRDLQVFETFSQTYDPNGAAIGTSQMVTGFASANEQVDQVSDDGSFARISFTSGVNLLTGQRLDADANPITDEFPISVLLAISHDVANLASGDFFVVLANQARDAIFLEQFHSGGLRLATDIALNEPGIHRIFEPRIAISPDESNVVVAWHGDTEGDNSAIFARRLNLEEPKIELAVPETVSELSSTVLATVTRQGFNTDANLEIHFSTGDPTLISPLTAIIPAGQDSATIGLPVGQDEIATGDRSTQITVSTGNFEDTKVIRIVDDEIPQLSISLEESSTMERDPGIMVVVTRNTPPAEELEVSLIADTPGQLFVPSTIQFAADETSATFLAIPLEDGQIDGTRLVQVTATADGHEAAQAEITVLDTPALQISAAPVSESDEVGQVIVTRNTPLVSTLPIELIVDGVPSMVAIPAGEASVAVDVNFPNDNFVSGDRTISIESSATGFIGATASLTIIEDDIPELNVELLNELIREGDVAMVRIQRNSTSPLDVRLATDSNSSLVVDQTASFLSGELSIDVDLAIGENVLADGDQTFEIMISADDHPTAAIQLLVIANTPPTVSEVSSQTTPQGQATDPIMFMIDDVESASQKLVLAASSSDQTLLPNTNLVLSGTGSQRTIVATPAPGQSGTATITISVTDEEGLTTSEEFDLVVTPDSRPMPVITLSSGGADGTQDPSDLPSGAQPTSWSLQRSSLRRIEVLLGSTASTVTASDLVLTNLGIDADNDPDTTISLRDDQLSLSEDSMSLIVSLDAGQMTDGVYQLDLLPSFMGDNAFTISGNETNEFFVLKGDWNGSGGVNIQDFATFAYWFGQGSPTSPSYVDLNDSGGVNIQDFAGFAANFGKAIVYPSATTGGEGEKAQTTNQPRYFFRDPAGLDGGQFQSADGIDATMEQSLFQAKRSWPTTLSNDQYFSQLHRSAKEPAQAPKEDNLLEAVGDVLLLDDPGIPRLL